MKTKPIHEIRFGQIKAIIWLNKNGTGARYNTIFSRLYKDGDQWKSTDNFGRDELLLVAKAADQAHSWICAQHQHERLSKPNETGSDNKHC